MNSGYHLRDHKTEDAACPAARGPPAGPGPVSRRVQRRQALCGLPVWLHYIQVGVVDCSESKKEQCLMFIYHIK